MVADVEFELDVTALADHLADQVVLVGVELDVTGLRKGFHGKVIAASLVVESLQRDGGRLDETQSAGLDHLPVEQGRSGIIFLERLLLRLVAAVPTADLAVFLFDLLVGCYCGRSQRVSSGGPVDGETP